MFPFQWMQLKKTRVRDVKMESFPPCGALVSSRTRMCLHHVPLSYLCSLPLPTAAQQRFDSMWNERRRKRLRIVRLQRNVCLMSLNWCHWCALLGASIHFCKTKEKTRPDLVTHMAATQIQLNLNRISPSYLLLFNWFLTQGILLREYAWIIQHYMRS